MSSGQIPPIVAILLAYASGSLPFAFLAGRLLKGIDLRTVGSGNLGATNVYRTLGAPAAILVLLLDALKGALPVLLLTPRISEVVIAPPGSSTGAWMGLVVGVAAIVGHAKPIFLLWEGGGKGVATTAGVFAALVPVALLVALGVFVLVVWRTRIVSLASMVAAVVLPAAVAWRAGPGSPFALVAIVIAGFVVWTHRANIERLRAGTEPRLGGPGGAYSAGSAS
jgi:acyl phosphate:glycerol-3-phosphate acyltransferase